MNKIDSYIQRTAKKYPRTKEVSEQLEEIRDTLHIKAEEFQAQGLSDEEAAQAAVDSVGDLSGLMGGVAGERRNIFVNRLYLHLSVYTMLIVTAEMLAGFAIAFAPHFIFPMLQPDKNFWQCFWTVIDIGANNFMDLARGKPFEIYSNSPKNTVY